jgi:hypothetical protein
MDDETRQRPPDVLRNGALQEGGEEDVRAKEVDGFPRHGVVDVEFERDLVAALAQALTAPGRGLAAASKSTAMLTSEFSLSSELTVAVRAPRTLAAKADARAASGRIADGWV